jgi:hypothetical protein
MIALPIVIAKNRVIISQLGSSTNYFTTFCFWRKKMIDY